MKKKSIVIVACLVVLAVISVPCSAGQENVEGTAVVERDSVLPEPFGLLTPADGATVTTPALVLDWEDSFDAHSGLSHYEVWVDGANVENVTTSEYETPGLSGGQHSWYAVAVDRAGNGRQSDNVFTFTVEVPGPSPSDYLIPVAVGALVFAAAYLLWRRRVKK